MGSKENAKEQSPKLLDKKLLDPFAELFASTSAKGQIIKDDTTNPGKGMDDILFSKIDPLDLSSEKNSSKDNKGSSMLDGGSNGKDIKEDDLQNDPILGSFLSPKNAEKGKEQPLLFSPVNKKTLHKKQPSISCQPDKLQQELLSLLSAQTNSQLKTARPLSKNPNTKGVNNSGHNIGFEILGPFICNNGSLMDTPKSPYFDAILANNHKNDKNKIDRIKSCEDLAKTIMLRDENSKFSIDSCFNADLPINTKSADDPININLKDSRVNVVSPITAKPRSGQTMPVTNMSYKLAKKRTSPHTNNNNVDVPVNSTPINFESMPFDMNISKGFAVPKKRQQLINPFESLYNVNRSGTPQTYFKPPYLQRSYPQGINARANSNFYAERPFQHAYGLGSNCITNGYYLENRQQRTPYEVNRELQDSHFRYETCHPSSIRHDLQQRHPPIRYGMQRPYPIGQDPQQSPRFRYNFHQPYSNMRPLLQANNTPFVGHNPNMFLNKQITNVSSFNQDRTQRPDTVKPVEKRNFLVLRTKLFSLKRIGDDKRMLIDKLSLTVDNLKYRFFRTLNEVADILELPRVSYHEAHELRMLFNLFTKCGGYLGASTHFLNYIKDITKKYLFKYLSYVLPLETSGYFYKPKIRTSLKKKTFKPTKEELNSVLCIGIYDDTFYFLDLLEQGEISETLIGELLNTFFLIFDNLFKNSGCALPLLDKIVNRLYKKPYKIVLDRMTRDVLYQLQEQVFKLILKYEKSKKTDQSFNDDTLFCIIELLLQKKALKKQSDIVNFDVGSCGMDPSPMHLKCRYENEYLWILMLIDAANTVIKPTPKIVDVLFEFDGADSGLILRVASKLLLDNSTIHRIFLKHEIYIIAKLETHMKTLESMILLNDEKELEIIITHFLPFLFTGTLPLISILNTVIKYKDHLLMKKVYFRKRRSSNVDTIIKHLKDRLSGD